MFSIRQNVFLSFIISYIFDILLSSLSIFQCSTLSPCLSIGCARIIFSLSTILFIIVFLILQQIEGNLIYPHVVGGSVGLPSIWVLAAVSVGGSLMGIVGMLIFIPLMSVVYALFREVVYIKLRQKNIYPQDIL